MSDVERVVPLAGPIEELRLSAFTDVQARGMLAQALMGVALGGLDREMLDYLARTDTRATVVVASLVRRAWAVGVGVGRAERLDEVAAVAAAHRATRDLADTVLALVAQANTDLDDAAADVRYLAECLVDDVTRAVGGYAAGSDRLAKAAAVSVARYLAVLAKSADDESAYEARQLALTVAVETAATMLDSDAELAAAVRAVVAADQDRDAAALAVLQGRVLQASEAPHQDQIRPEMTVPDARPADRWCGDFPLPAWWDGVRDGEDTCAAPGWDDLAGRAGLRQLCTRPDGHGGRHMAAFGTTCSGRPPAIVCAWPGRGAPARTDMADAPDGHRDYVLDDDEDPPLPGVDGPTYDVEPPDAHRACVLEDPADGHRADPAAGTATTTTPEGD
jgi:hypothetical protein